MASVLETCEPAVVSADGTKIWAAHAGRRSTEAPTLVLIPGSSSSSIFFERQFEDETLLAKLSLITYEPRGQGRSGSPADATFMSSKKFAEDFDAVCKHYGATRVYVGGWSAGGVVPCDVFAHLSPAYIAGMIHIAAPPYRSAFPPMAHPKGAQVVLPLIQSQDGETIVKAVSELTEVCVYGPNLATMAYTLRTALAGVAALQPPRNRLLTHLGHQQDPTALLAHASATEVLLLVGVQDEMILPDKLEAKLAAEFPLLQVVRVPEAGHAVFWEKPDQVNRALVAFVGRVEGKQKA